MHFKLSKERVLAHISSILENLNKQPLSEEYTRPYKVIMREIVALLSDGNNSNELDSYRFENDYCDYSFIFFLGRPGDLPDFFLKAVWSDIQEMAYRYPDWFIVAFKPNKPEETKYIFPVRPTRFH